MRLDVRDRQTLVREQGLRPTCLACAATSGHEYLRGDGRALSVEYLHWACVRTNGPSRDGATLHAAVRVLVDIGQPAEDVWPYQPDVDENEPNYEPPSAAHSCDLFRVISGKQVAPLVESLQWYLRSGNAVLVGLRLTYEFHASADGRIGTLDGDGAGKTCGRHMVLLVGYDDQDGVFIFKNSWGEAWGDHGYGYLPYSYLKEHGLVSCILANKEVE